MEQAAASWPNDRCYVDDIVAGGVVWQGKEANCSEAGDNQCKLKM
jgi:hypothetical protein